jgi:hypothetical protein
LIRWIVSATAMRVLFKTLFILLLFQQVNAQSVSTSVGARSSSLGNASCVVTDEWSLLNNIGGLAAGKEINTAFTFEAKPAIPGASRMAAIFTSPLKIGSIGVGVFKFGDQIYSEQIVTAGYGNQFGIASLGLKFNFIQYRAEGFGIKRVLSVSTGGVATITPQLSIGAYIQNINQPKLTNGERVPVRLAAGLAFQPTEQVTLITEVEKELAFDPTLKAGVEYSIHKKVFARTGFNLLPEAAFFGIGFKNWRLKFDYALQYNNTLNFGHQASACYRIEKNKKNSNTSKPQ